MKRHLFLIKKRWNNFQKLFKHVSPSKILNYEIEILMFLAGFFHRKKIRRKINVKNFAGIHTKTFWELPDIQYCCGILFWYQKNVWRLWSIFGHPAHSMAGLFFKNCQKFWQKSTKNDTQHKLCDAKYCAVWVEII